SAMTQGSEKASELKAQAQSQTEEATEVVQSKLGELDEKAKTATADLMTKGSELLSGAASKLAGDAKSSEK
ncbi:MAG: hypothetical protein SGPRY_004423, partial [Prymnesium sp.]